MVQALLQMTAGGTGGTEDAAANINIPQDGVIEGITIAHTANLNADSEGSDAELSFIATNQMAQNDARGVLAVSKMNMGLLTTGAGIASNNFHVPMDVDVSGGERLYIHFVASAGVVSSVTIMIHFRGRGGVTRRSARRRG